MSQEVSLDFAALYAAFEASIAALDCGERCAPYNAGGAPFCCDLQHAVPTAYQAEWGYLQAHTDLWRLLEEVDPAKAEALRSQAPEGHALIACLGHRHCQRDFRAVTCRAFPFFPYITREGEFIGLSYYWEYEDRCWVISNLQVVTPEYVTQFMAAYQALFERLPEERETFRYHSTRMRRAFGQRRRAIPLLHRNGAFYKVTPGNGRMRRVEVERLPKFGVYKVAAELPFEGEEEGR
jgi:hypothetical protein